MPGILVIRLRGLGDIVHTLPSLKVLRERFPDEQIGFVCQKPFGQIVPPELRIEVLELPGKADFWTNMRFVRTIRRRKYDRLIDFFCNPRTALISQLSGIPWRVGFAYRVRRFAYHQTFVPKDPNRHLSELFGEFLDHFSLGGKIGHPEMAFSETDFLEARKFLDGQGHLKPFLGINPHATYPAKAWPQEYFKTFIDLWHSRVGSRVLLFWGPGEKDRTDRLLHDLGPEKVFTHPPLSLPLLLGYLKNLDYFFTTDSGPMNLAWALNVPTTTLFGPTTRRAVAPREPQHLVLFHERLDCLQCHKEVCDDGRCMSEMTPEWVFQKMNEKYAFPREARS